MGLIIFSYIADLVFGDPETWVHPVRGMGKLIGFLDKHLRRKSAVWLERLKGSVLTIIVVGGSTFAAYLILKYSIKINLIFGNLVWIYLGYTTLSIKDLKVKAKTVFKELKKNNIKKAQKNLSKIVGRDTGELDEASITRATIESIAENTNDGIVAPLFYLIFGGPILAIAYKAVNTLDSMVGYKNEKYRYFGWFSAKLDDLANFIPARICGVLIAVSSVIANPPAGQVKQSQRKIASLVPCGDLLAMTASLKIMYRYGKKHPSPNSGISEAAMAGALGIRLGGESTYEGKLSVKPYIGEEKRVIKPNLINKALRISFTASIFMLLTGIFLKWII